MQSTSQNALVFAGPPVGAVKLHRTNDEWAYQAVTVAAILLVLGSLWIF